MISARLPRLFGILVTVAFSTASLGALHALPAQQPPLAPAAAAESTLDARTRAVASDLRCPVCQGLSIQDSPSELAQQMRDLVKQQLDSGRSPAQIKDYFVGRYGEWILMAPEAHGFNWLVYLLPFLVLGFGGWILLVALRRWTVSKDVDANP